MAVTPRQGRLGAVSDPGLVRPNNEDTFRVLEEHCLFAVADGMGGHKAGEVAAKLAVEALSLEPFNADDPAAALEAMIRTAHRRIREEGARNPDTRGMGTTLTVAHVGPRYVTVAHVGDSRAYLLGRASPRQLTRDHSLTGELVYSGQLEPEEARRHPQRHVLTQAVGAQETLSVDVVRAEWAGWDYLLLCTDGLTEVVSEAEMTAIVREAESAEQGAQALVRAARDYGAPDNVTVVLYDLRLHDGACPGQAG